MGEKLVGGPAVYGWGAELFFLPSLMGKFFFFAGATAPPSHYVAPPLESRIELYKYFNTLFVSTKNSV